MMLTAHSGSDNTPDNSLEFVRYALALAPDAFEVDVHRRADGALVIAHDSDPTREYPNCPTLHAVCALAAEKPKIGINYDCKDAGLELDVCALHRAVCPENPIFLSGSLSPETYLREREAFGSAVPLLNAEELVPDFYVRMLSGAHQACAEEAARTCKSTGARLVNVFYWCCPDVFLDTLRAHGLDASVWTVDEPEAALHFSRRGVFNLTTRRPAALLALLQGQANEGGAPAQS